jgi:2-polyprenyl-3-methyl-5-hydroxy-6-metoxy-1,4-benzoquinol methylase
MENIVSCPVCGEKTFNPFIQCKDFSISKELFNIVECAQCGFVFTNPRPGEKDISQYYNSEIYISHHANKGGIIPWIYRKVRGLQFIYKTNIIKSYFKTPVSILDIGCGTGDFLKYCETFNWKTIGVEPDSDARKQAGEKGIPVYEVAHLNELKDKFDVITMWHVLEHVNDLAERMEQLKRLIKDDGILIIAVPNRNSMDARYYKSYWAAYDVPRHLSHFTTESISNLFRKYDFNLVETLPMKYDAYYVSLKSEEYKGHNFLITMYNGAINGLLSNNDARKTNEYSSVIYVFKK